MVYTLKKQYQYQFMYSEVIGGYLVHTTDEFKTIFSEPRPTQAQQFLIRV